MCFAGNPRPVAILSVCGSLRWKRASYPNSPVSRRNRRSFLRSFQPASIADAITSAAYLILVCRSAPVFPAHPDTKLLYQAGLGGGVTGNVEVVSGRDSGSKQLFDGETFRRPVENAGRARGEITNGLRCVSSTTGSKYRPITDGALRRDFEHGRPLFKHDVDRDPGFRHPVQIGLQLLVDRSIAVHQ